ncbi:MAG: hypothetical protein ACR2IK_05690 [Chloroflexota bacterium]
MPNTTTLFVVELRCLACGRDHDITVGTLVDLPRLPQRCAVCGGSVLAMSAASRIVRTERAVDWNVGKKKLGHPLKLRLPLFEEKSA